MSNADFVHVDWRDLGFIGAGCSWPWALMSTAAVAPPPPPEAAGASSDIVCVGNCRRKAALLLLKEKESKSRSEINRNAKSMADSQERKTSKEQRSNENAETEDFY